MKPVFKSMCFYLAPVVVAMSLFLPAVAQEKTALQKERTAKMKILARSMFQLKNAPNAASMKAPATAIAATSRKLANMWPEGSGGTSTRAKLEIWAKMGDFKAKLMDMQNAADELVSATGVADLSVAKSAFSGVGRACAACHKVYRRPKV